MVDYFKKVHEKYILYEINYSTLIDSIYREARWLCLENVLGITALYITKSKCYESALIYLVEFFPQVEDGWQLWVPFLTVKAAGKFGWPH